MESKNRQDKVIIVYTYNKENKPVWSLETDISISFKTKKQLLEALDFIGPLKSLKPRKEVSPINPRLFIKRPAYEVDFTKNQKYKDEVERVRKFKFPLTVEEAAINYQLTSEKRDLDLIAKYLLKKYQGFIFNKIYKRSDYSDGDVKSIVSDVVMRIHKSILKWNSAKFTTWVHSCIINEIKVYYQTKQRQSKEYLSFEFETERHDDVDILNNQRYGVQESTFADMYVDQESIYMERRKILDDVIDESFTDDDLQFVRDYFTGNYTVEGLAQKYSIEEYDAKNRVSNAKKVIKKNKKISEYQSEFI